MPTSPSSCAQTMQPATARHGPDAPHAEARAAHSCEVLGELEWNGILVDPDELDRQRERLQAASTHRSRRSECRDGCRPSAALRPRLPQATRRRALQQARRCRLSPARAQAHQANQDRPLHRRRSPRKARQDDTDLTTRSPPNSSSSTANSPNSSAPTSSRSRRRSTRRPGASTRVSTRPSPRRGASPPAIPTSRTSPSAPTSAARSAKPSSPRPGASSSPPTTRRSNSACSRISPKIPASSRPSSRAPTSTPPSPPRSTASRSRSHQGPALRREDGQLRHRLRHHGLRPRPPAQHRQREAAEIITGYKKRFAASRPSCEECIEQARR
jgi:hypothetical protein